MCAIHCLSEVRVRVRSVLPPNSLRLSEFVIAITDAVRGLLSGQAFGFTPLYICFIPITYPFSDTSIIATLH